MVGALIHLRLTAQRHSTSPARTLLRGLGVLAGSLLAIVTLIWAARSFADREVMTDNVALALGLWWVGWALAPSVGGEDPALRPENFRLLPLRPRRLVAALSAASLAGIPAALTLVACGSLLVLAIRERSSTAIAVSILALVLQLLLYVLTGKIVTDVFGESQGSRLGREAAALVMAVAITATILGPLTISRAAPALAAPWPGWAHATIMAVPSSWASDAVSAAGSGHAGRAVLILAGLGALCSGLLALWSVLLRRRLVAERAPSGSVSVRINIEKLLPATPLGGVVARELHTWARDLLRARFLRVALWLAILVTLATTMLGLPSLPFAGVLFVVFAAMFGGNTIGLDGTSLWLSILTPRSASAELRGRQLAWLLVVAPWTAALTAGGLAAARLPWAVIPAVALCLAALGAGSGVTALVSVVAPVMKTDPHLRGRNLSDEGSNVVGQVLQAQLLLYATAASLIPTLAVEATGLFLGLAPVALAGIAVGAATGTIAATLLGRIAAKTLKTRETEILARMRGHGMPVSAPQASRRPPGSKNGPSPRERHLPHPPSSSTSRLDADESAAEHGRRPDLRPLYLALAGTFVLVFEGVIPALALHDHQHFTSRFWYLPLYLPAPASAIASLAATGAGLTATVTGSAVGLRELIRRHRSRRNT